MNKSKKISKVTAGLWRKVKAVDTTCKDDAPIAAKFNIGVSTACRIRKTSSYDEYVTKYAGNHDKKAKIEVLDSEDDELIDEVQNVAYELMNYIDDATRKLGWLMFALALAIFILILVK